MQIYNGNRQAFDLLKKLRQELRTAAHRVRGVSEPVMRRGVLGSEGPVMMVSAIGYLAIVDAMSLRGCRLVSVRLLSSQGTEHVRTYEIEMLARAVDAALPFLAWLAYDPSVAQPSDCTVQVGDLQVDGCTHYLATRGLVRQAMRHGRMGRSGREVSMQEWLSFHPAPAKPHTPTVEEATRWN